MTGIQALARIAPDHPCNPADRYGASLSTSAMALSRCWGGLDVAAGQVKALCRPTRTEADFLDLVDGLVQTRPQAPKITFVLDNLNTHHPKAWSDTWLATPLSPRTSWGPRARTNPPNPGQPRSLPERSIHRIRFSYTPKHASWMNQIEILVRHPGAQVIRRGNFTSLADLQHKLEAFVEYFNRTMAKPLNGPIRASLCKAWPPPADKFPSPIPGRLQSGSVMKVHALTACLFASSSPQAEKHPPLLRSHTLSLAWPHSLTNLRRGVLV